VANVAGLFFVCMDVIDQSGTKVKQLSSSTQKPRHVIRIENISDATKSAHVFASLPHGMIRIEFIKNNISGADWDDHILNIPPGARREASCELRRNGGPAGRNEPLQCDRLDHTQGTLPPIRLWQGLPTQHTIDVV
jgi:hypothetical protein